MAAGLIGGSGRQRNGGSRQAAYRPMSEINVTPLVDVMLVLLIVFMVAAPLLTVGVPVDLPKAQAPAINENKEPLVVTVNADQLRTRARGHEHDQRRRLHQGLAGCRVARQQAAQGQLAVRRT